MNYFYLILLLFFLVFVVFSVLTTSKLMRSLIFQGWRRILCFFIIWLIPFFGAYFIRYLIDPPQVDPSIFDDKKPEDWSQSIGSDYDSN